MAFDAFGWLIARFPLEVSMNARLPESTTLRWERDGNARYVWVYQAVNYQGAEPYRIKVDGWPLDGIEAKEGEMVDVSWVEPVVNETPTFPNASSTHTITSDRTHRIRHVGMSAFDSEPFVHVELVDQMGTKIDMMRQKLHRQSK